MERIRQGDLGVTLQLTVNEDGSALDISAATTKQLKLRQPDGTVVTYTADFVTDGTDGALEATSATGSSDFPDAGIYRIWARLVIGAWDGQTTDQPMRAEPPGAL